MARIKLSEYCKQNGISYLTGYRWFKDGKLPVNAIQTDSGTILVDVPEITNERDINLFLQKAFEFSQNNASINDFAAHIISNFSLKSNTVNIPSTYVCCSTDTSPNLNTINLTSTTSFSTDLSTSNISFNGTTNIPSLPLAQSDNKTYDEKPAILDGPLHKNKKSKKESK